MSPEHDCAGCCTAPSPLDESAGNYSCDGCGAQADHWTDGEVPWCTPCAEHQRLFGTT